MKYAHEQTTVQRDRRQKNQWPLFRRGGKVKILWADCSTAWIMSTILIKYSIIFITHGRKIFKDILFCKQVEEKAKGKENHNPGQIYDGGTLKLRQVRQM